MAATQFLAAKALSFYSVWWVPKELHVAILFVLAILAMEMGINTARLVH